MSALIPVQTNVGALSDWASFDTLLQRLDITTEPNFWDGLVTLIHYQDYFLESQYHDLEEGCVPGEAQQGPNKTQTPNPPSQPDPECLCANSPFYAWEIHGIECTEYRLLYWYHPDYGTSRATVARSKARLATVMRDLGHNEFITDMAGLPYQYFHYSAFGETLVEDNAHYGQFSSPYRFNAKELDQEPSRASSRTPLKNKTWGEQTGNYYYGARYYNPTWSVWLGVDQLAHKYPSMSPFVFTGNNPIMLVDPDGRKIIVANKVHQSMILQYLNDQFGTSLYKFNKRGELRMNKKAFRAARANLSPEQLNIILGLNRVIKDNRIIEVKLYPNQQVNFTRNPLEIIESTYYDPDLQKEITRKENRPVFQGGDGHVITNLGNEALTVAFPDDDRAFILMDYNASQTGTFEAEDGGATDPCPSCIFIHEILDHGLDYINNGNVKEPKGSTKKDNVYFHNEALINMGSSPRTGDEHKP